MILVRIVCPPPDSSISPCHGNGWKCQLGEKLAVSPCVVIDIRSCWSKFPGLSPTEIVRNPVNPESRCWSQLSTSADNNTYCVGALWDSGQGGPCSFNGRLNECVRCMAFTALFTFLDHMEILQHYILTESSVWFGRERERGGGKEGGCASVLVVCHVMTKLSPSCLMGKMKFGVCFGCIAWSWMAFSVAGWACLFCNRCFAVVSIWPYSCSLAMCLFERNWVHVRDVALRWKGEIETERTARC